mmetsp:Transcript_37362/g.107277  ORF Transcript_37362/g.107277 Transcript_37362/m.107277 type:complete len:348 (-) Transcript_37362:477-1520(-)
MLFPAAPHRRVHARRHHTRGRARTPYHAWLQTNVILRRAAIVGGGPHGSSEGNCSGKPRGEPRALPPVGQGQWRSSRGSRGWRHRRRCPSAGGRRPGPKQVEEVGLARVAVPEVTDTNGPGLLEPPANARPALSTVAQHFALSHEAHGSSHDSHALCQTFHHFSAPDLTTEVDPAGGRRRWPGQHRPRTPPRNVALEPRHAGGEALHVRAKVRTEVLDLALELELRGMRELAHALPELVLQRISEGVHGRGLPRDRLQLAAKRLAQAVQATGDFGPHVLLQGRLEGAREGDVLGLHLRQHLIDFGHELTAQCLPGPIGAGLALPSEAGPRSRQIRGALRGNSINLLL